MSIAATVILIVGVYALLLSISNLIALRRQKPSHLEHDGPLVSVCIPARNEEANIANCVNSMRAQSYRNIEILVLDDSSEDRTAEIVKSISAEDPRVRYIKGLPLQKGWKGKIYGMKQLLETSRGEYLLFTDADTIHGPDSVAYGVAFAKKHDADLISGYPMQEINNYMAATTVSAMVINTCLWMPLAIQKHIHSACFSMCIGQYLFMRRQAMIDVGGFAPIRDQIADDVSLARMYSRAKKQVMFTDLKEHVSCRMYDRGADAIKGISRSLLGVLPLPLAPLLGVAAAILLSLCLSGVFSIAWLVSGGWNPYALMMLTGTLLLRASWYSMARFHGFRPVVAASQIPVFLITVFMFLSGLFRRRHGKVIWKGREV